MATLHTVQPAIEVDPTFGVVAGSDYESDLSEYSTESLSSSIRAYRYENGRRYHAYKDGLYLMPNDEVEQERLDIIHHVYLLLLDGKLQLAPVDKGIQRILDVGTGTGIWAIDAAEVYPSAEVIGTDISPIQPSWVPPNVSFQIDDAEDTWTFAPESFDLVHIRHLNGGIKDWGKLLKQAYKSLKPGGYIDVSEYEMHLSSDDGTLSKSSHISRFYDLIGEAGDKAGQEFHIAVNLGPLLEAAGFVGTHHESMKIPLGTWPAEKKQKELGAYLMLCTEGGFEAVGMALLTRVLGMPVQQVEELIKAVKKESRGRQIHSYSMQHLYYGQKPKKKE